MKKLCIALLLAAFLLTVFSACIKKPKNTEAGDLPKKVTIGTAVGVSPEAIAIAEGWLPEALGTEVDIVHFDSGRDVIVGMASGSIDLGHVGTPPASLAIANGVPCRIVYVQSVLGETESLIVRGNLGIKNAQGLVGRRIAVTFSSTSHYGLVSYLRINNVKPSDIDIIDMRAGEIVAAFIRGNIDGAFTWDPYVTQMRNNGGVMLTSAREMADLGYAIMYIEMVRNEFAERYPHLVSAYIRTMDKAIALYRSDPKAAAAALARFTGMTAEECLAQVEKDIWLTAEEQRGMRWAGSSALGNLVYNTAMFFYEQGDILEKPSIEVFQNGVTGQYLEPYTGK